MKKLYLISDGKKKFFQFNFQITDFGNIATALFFTKKRIAKGFYEMCKDFGENTNNHINYKLLEIEIKSIRDISKEGNYV